MPKAAPLYIAVTHTVNSDARTGVQTVVRGLVRGLQQIAETELVAWHKPWKSFVVVDPKLWQRGVPEPEIPPRPPSKKLLAPLYRSKFWKAIRHWKRYRQSSIHRHPRYHARLKGAWLILPELIYGAELTEALKYARRRRLRTAIIFHDAIPVLHPELVRREAALYHDAYMRAIARADIVIAVSKKSADDFRRFARENNLSTPTIVACALAGEIADQERLSAKINNGTAEVHALCVCTVEPRKNHRTLLEAFALASTKLPHLHLHLVGDRYRDADDLAKIVEEAAHQHPNLQWHGRLLPDELRRLYELCDFTVYPSFLEGFGLPVTESLWNRRPCICADVAPMAENAAGGGCLTTNVLDVVALSEAMLRLATQPNLRRKLADEIELRKIRTWQDYARDILSILTAAKDSDVLA